MAAVPFCRVFGGMGCCSVPSESEPLRSFPVNIPISSRYNFKCPSRVPSFGPMCSFEKNGDEDHETLVFISWEELRNTTYEGGGPTDAVSAAISPLYPSLVVNTSSRVVEYGSSWVLRPVKFVLGFSSTRGLAVLAVWKQLSQQEENILVDDDVDG